MTRGAGQTDTQVIDFIILVNSVESFIKRLMGFMFVMFDHGGIKGWIIN